MQKLEPYDSIKNDLKNVSWLKIMKKYDKNSV